MTVELSYDDVGSGMPLVLLHAFPLSAQMWGATRAGLADTCRVITPDARGFGRSPLGDAAPSLDVAADDVARLLDRLELDRVVLGGLSMGGYVTMAFLRRHPDRVRAVLLADTKATADPAAARANRERIARALLDAPRSPVLVTDVLPSLLGETTTRSRPAVAAEVKRWVRAAPAAAAAWAQRAMADRPDSLDTLRATDLPALVLVGDEDALSPVIDAARMAEALPQGSVRVLGGAGHLTAVETPAAFVAAVGRFLTALT